MNIEMQINEQLEKLKHHLTSLKDTTAKIDKANGCLIDIVAQFGETNKVVGELITVVQNSYESQEQKIEDLITRSAEIFNQYRELTETIGEVDFPNRLDKIDTTLATTLQQGQGLLNKLEVLTAIKEQNMEIQKTLKDQNIQLHEALEKNHELFISHDQEQNKLSEKMIEKSEKDEKRFALMRNLLFVIVFFLLCIAGFLIYKL
jgi:uncharacterized protein YeeX (DUF496 family)